MLSVQLRRLSSTVGAGLLVYVRNGVATFGLPPHLRSNDPDAHKALQKSTVTYLPKTYLKDLGYYPGVVYETHISVHPDLQGKGYAAKMIQALALKLRKPLWLMKARIINPHVYSVVKKLQADPLVTVTPIEYDGDVQGWVITT